MDIAAEQHDQVDAAVGHRPTVPSALVRIRASDAAAGIGGRLIGPDVEFEGASFDSRATVPGQLFIPIVAERNGHEFIGAARERGAIVHLTSETDPYRRDGTAIEVADTAQALLALAAWARRRLDARVVGVTGSVGKTSAKDLMAATCGAGRRTTANERSFNNEQGLPVTILNAPDDTEVLILEMGMRGFGHISQLCEIARPDVGVVTVVGHAHTEMVGGIDGVARAKGELVEALPASGTAVLNADDERVVGMAKHTGASVLTYGRGGEVCVRDLVLDERARPRFTIPSRNRSPHDHSYPPSRNRPLARPPRGRRSGPGRDPRGDQSRPGREADGWASRGEGDRGAGRTATTAQRVRLDGCPLRQMAGRVHHR